MKNNNLEYMQLLNKQIEISRRITFLKEKLGTDKYQINKKDDFFKTGIKYSTISLIEQTILVATIILVGATIVEIGAFALSNWASSILTEIGIISGGASVIVGPTAFYIKKIREEKHKIKKYKLDDDLYQKKVYETELTDLEKKLKRINLMIQVHQSSAIINSREKEVTPEFDYTIVGGETGKIDVLPREDDMQAGMQPGDPYDPHNFGGRSR
ncbi:MAG: hypothetical protein PHD02_04415 [Bacilli bacterium]|nr:hypothetical protein [Bacilli bacterium]